MAIQLQGNGGTVKYESVYLPCGMGCFVSKEESSRHSDLYFLRESDINRKPSIRKSCRKQSCLDTVQKLRR